MLENAAIETLELSELQRVVFTPFLDAVNQINELRRQREFELGVAVKLILAGMGVEPDRWTGHIDLADDGVTLLLRLKAESDG